MTFAQNEEGDWGYIPSGADAVIPFSSIPMPFESSYALGAANFLTSYAHVYSEIKIPVGKASKTFSITAKTNMPDAAATLTVTGEDGKVQTVNPTNSSEQSLSLDISASNYVTLRFDKIDASNTGTYMCSGVYTIE